MKKSILAAAICAVAVLTWPAPVMALGTGPPPEVASTGVTVAQWEMVREEARRLANQARVSERALQAAAEATGARFASSGKFNALSLQSAVIEALGKQTEQLAELEARLERLTGDTDPGIAKLFTEARAALEAGRLREADRLLADVASRDLAGLKAADAETERLRLRAGETIALRAYLASLQGAYLEAASEFERAGGTVPDSAVDRRWLYSTWQADTLKTYGERFVDLDRLREAVRIYRAVTLPMATRSLQPANLGMTHNNIGTALLVIGERSSPDDLRAALQAFDEALSETSSTRDPVGWSQTQLNRGVAFSALEELGEPGALAEAILAYEAGLRTVSPQMSQELWGQLNMNLGVAYRVQSARDGDLALRLSAEAFQRALGVWTEADAGRQWARVHVNLGTTRSEQYIRGDLRAMEPALAAYENAQRVLTRESDPDSWANLQGNLGTLYKYIAQAGDPSAFENARSAYLAALSVFTEQDDPNRWAQTQFNLGQLYRMMAATIARGDREVALKSVEALEHAASVRSPERGIRDYVETQLELGKCLGMLALTGDTSALDRSILALNIAIVSGPRTANQDVKAEARMQLGLSYLIMSDFDAYDGISPEGSLLKSRDYFREAAGFLTPANFPQEASFIARQIALVERRLESAD